MNISNVFFKSIKTCLLISLTGIINLMLLSEIFPEQLKIAKVIPGHYTKKVIKLFKLIISQFYYYHPFQKKLQKLFLTNYTRILTIIIYFIQASTGSEKLIRLSMRLWN